MNEGMKWQAERFSPGGNRFTSYYAERPTEQQAREQNIIPGTIREISAAASPVSLVDLANLLPITAIVEPDAGTVERAGKIADALTFAATDPSIRLQMVMGQTYSRYLGVIDWLVGQLENEKPEVMDLARAKAGKVALDIKDIHHQLLTAAVLESAEAGSEDGTRSQPENDRTAQHPADHSGDPPAPNPADGH